LLLTSGGEHAGTISGGCLEAEVSRKAWWLTANGPCLERYSSFADEDGGMPYGLGCGGTVSLLLEQGDAVRAVLDALALGTQTLQPAVLVMALRSTAAGGLGTLAVLCDLTAKNPLVGVPRKQGLAALYLRDGSLPTGLAEGARIALSSRRSCFLNEAFAPCESAIIRTESGDAVLPAYRIEYLAPPPALTIFGAGDDALPLAEMAQALGWRVTVADGRAHLARLDRFPEAAAIRVLDYADPRLRAACGIAGPLPSSDYGPASWTPPDPAASGNLESDDFAVILTHSYEQDRALLAALLPRGLRYLGILGPRHRTERLLLEVTPALGLSIEDGFDRLHSPVGLDLGAGDPAAVALSIIAEMQAMLNNRRVSITRLAPLEPSFQGEPRLTGKQQPGEAVPGLVTEARG
jgi:xanthine/CO dehydrogenase XdhC/CoxF family maturation factor